MMKRLTIALALVAFAPIAAHSADRDAVAKQVAEKCRKAYPILGIEPNEYAVQLGCRMSEMEFFDQLEREDRDREAKKKAAGG